MQYSLCVGFFFSSEKTKNLLLNGAKAVMGKIWTGEESCTEQRPTAETPACSQSLLKGQTLIGRDGKLTKANTAQGEPKPIATGSVSTITQIRSY